MAPRGAAKSTWVSFAYPLWAAVTATEPYILLLADVADQARKYLESIRSELDTNELLAQDFPEATGKAAVSRGDRVRLSNGVLIEALGTGGKVRGRKNRASRPSLVIIDDPQNGDGVQSAIQRERDWNWLTREVMAVGTVDTNFLVLGTSLHRDAIVCRLQRTPGWKTQVFQSIVQWPVRMDLWAEWESILHDWDDPQCEEKARAFYEAHRAEMDA
jgi:hypothetical protein